MRNLLRRWRASTFVLLTLSGSWAGVALLYWMGWLTPPRVLTELFSISISYALLMGAPLLLAVWALHRSVRPLDWRSLGLHDVGLSINIRSALLALLLVGVSSMLSSLVGPPFAATIVAAPPAQSTFIHALLLLLVFLGTLSLLWAQAFIEELGWRGYLLRRSMQQIGSWGVFASGLLWALWYAPLLLLSGAPHVGVFLLSLALLGSLLAFVRLWVNSVSAAASANLMITTATGLPYLLYGREVGVRSALFTPIGCLVMGLALLLALLVRRNLLTLPEEAPNDCPVYFDESGDRLLH